MNEIIAFLETNGPKIVSWVAIVIWSLIGLGLLAWIGEWLVDYKDKIVKSWREGRK